MTISRYSFVFLAAMAVPFAHGAAQAPGPMTGVGLSSAADDAREREKIVAMVTAAWERSDFAALDAMADRFASTHEKIPGGKYSLQVYNDTVKDFARIDWPSAWNITTSRQCQCNAPDPARYSEAERRWNKVRVRFDLWMSSAPVSSSANVALAHYWRKRAWFYRGGGYAGSVPAPAWQLFERYTAEARKVLIAHEASAGRNPAWFSVMINVSRDEDWSRRDVRRLAGKLFREAPWYVPAYQSMASTLIPRWGGSYKTVDGFTRAAISHVPADQRDETYARIYMNLEMSGEPSLFKVSQADWPTMKRGLDDLAVRYPNVQNIEAKAKFACMAGDREAFKAAYTLLDGRLNASGWPVPLQTCRAL
jgi:hypothetical protein